MLTFTEFLLQRHKRYDTFVNAFQDYHKHVTGQDLERLAAEYRAFRKVIYNEERDGEDEEEDVTQSPGLKGGNFDFGSYTYDGESVSGNDPSSLVSDYTASQMLQASMGALMESHVGKSYYFHRRQQTLASREVGNLLDIFFTKYLNSSSAASDQVNIPMLDKAVDQEAHTDYLQGGAEEDMDSKSDDDGDDDSKKDGNDDVRDFQKEGGDILNKNTKDDGQENLQEILDQNPGQKNLGQEHQAQGSEVSTEYEAMESME
ncbi:hypothetical protein CPB97_009420 [Podila verticillata]|nr:hypothetical protein CPB97_009420 [Podila verticillata]